MKKSLLLLALLLFCATPLLATESKLAFVDLQKALNNCEAGKAAKEEISSMAKEYQPQLDQKQNELRNLKQELDKKAKALSAEALTTREAELDKKFEEYQLFAKGIQDKLQKKDNELTKAVIEDLLKISNNFGVKEGYTMILEKNAVIFYADPSVDLTDKVIKAYDASRKK